MAKTGTLGTTSEHYTADYYAAHLGTSEPYSWETPHWREFFTRVADRLIAVTEPKSALDVGCARGLLVQALAARGVDARGFDISEHAIESAHEDVRARLTVASATEPIQGRFDLVTCIEALEHMAPDAAQHAIDNITAVTDRVVISSSPGDYAEPTHVNVHATADWVAWFAERGFYRRTDVDLSFLTPWAVYFERASLTTRDVVHRYESVLTPLKTEIAEARAALLDQSTSGAAESSEVVRLREALTASRDHVVGLEARIARLQGAVAKRNRENDRLRDRIAQLRSELKAVKASTTWRVGSALVKPAASLRRKG